MTTQGQAAPKRTVILGGGGVVGVAWQTGLLTGLRDAGVDLASASAVMGTSAGSLVGALLATGRDVSDALAMLAGAAAKVDFSVTGAGAESEFVKASRQVAAAADPRKALQAIGSAALAADTPIGEDDYLGLFDSFAGTAWPAGFQCTAVNTASGKLVVWDQDSGAALQRAVAASCVVPMLFPAVTVHGARYMDGGIRSHLNATAAPPSDIAVVVSCLPLGLPGDEAGNDVPGSTIASNAELARLRETTQVVAIDPDFSDLDSPVNMLDPQIAGQALQIGMQQGAREAASIQAVWRG